MFLCEECKKEFKSLGGLNAHKHYKHIGVPGTRPPLDTPPVGKPMQVEAPTVTFVSPKSASLRIVVVPSWQKLTDTPSGVLATRSPGKTVEFLEGRFATDDPEIINFLENKYKDDRYPVFSDRKMREMGRGLK